VAIVIEGEKEAMTESDWLSCEDPALMLAHIEGKVSLRRLRLFAHALMWTEGVGPDNENEPKDAAGWLWSYFRDYGPAVAEVPKTAAALLREIIGNPFRPVTVRYRQTCWSCSGHKTVMAYRGEPSQGHATKPCHTCNATGHLHAGERWLTPQVLTLAEAAYEERPGRKCKMCMDGEVNWGDRCKRCHGTGRLEDGSLDLLNLMAVADALEDAGADGESDLVLHLRGLQRKAGVTRICTNDDMVVLSGPHYRGCWALDVILGRE
jgi:hypothetical protein